MQNNLKQFLQYLPDVFVKYMWIKTPLQLLGATVQ